MDSPARTDLSLEEGRRAPAERLAQSLALAPLPYLEGALENPAMAPNFLLLLLKNRVVTPGLILKIARRESLLDPSEVKTAIVFHPKTPRHLAMLLLQFLWWRDLARIADQQPLPAPRRRAAERLLSVRLQGMAMGEKVTLARIASRGVIAALRQDDSPMVIRALLQNPRLTEEDALAIAGAKSSPGPVLQALAEDGRFARRPAVRKALLQNHETPPSTALRLLQGLSTRTLKELSSGPHLPQLVRVAALRLIETREGSHDHALTD